MITVNTKHDWTTITDRDYASSMNPLGERIRWALTQGPNPMSQAELARRCGWSGQSRVGNYLARSGKPNEPKLADIDAMAMALGVRPQWLLTGEEPRISGTLPDTEDPSTSVEREIRALRAVVAALASWATTTSTGANVSLSKKLRMASKGMGGVALIENLQALLSDPPSSTAEQTKALLRVVG